MLAGEPAHLIHFSQGPGVPQAWQSLKVLFPLDSSNSAKKLALRDCWGGGRVQRAGNVPQCEESGSEGHGHWGLPGCVWLTGPLSCSPQPGFSSWPGRLNSSSCLHSNPDPQTKPKSGVHCEDSSAVYVAGRHAGKQLFWKQTLTSLPSEELRALLQACTLTVWGGNRGDQALRDDR